MNNSPVSAAKKNNHHNRLSMELLTLEDRVMLSTVQIFAAGSENTETMVLEIDGTAVQTFENIGGDASVGTFQTYEWSTPDTITPSQVRIRFTNDVYDPANGIDANLRVDAIVIDGERFETEDPSVFSTGTWKPEDGITPGNRESEFLHANGYLQFVDPPGGPGEGSDITVNARGDEGFESFALEINGVRVQTWTEIGTTQNAFQYSSSAEVTANDIRVVFLNDRYEPENGIDANLIVDSIVIDGETFETEADTVISTGTWKPEDGIVTGFRESETLHSNGYFQYSAATTPAGEGVFRLASSQYSVSEGDGSVQVEIVREVSTVGSVSLDFATVEATATQGSDYVANSGTLTFQDGESSKFVTIAILDDPDNEDDEQFNFAIDNLTGNATLSAPRTATILIDDNDSVQGTGDGLFGEYFDNINLTNRTNTRVDGVVDFDWGRGAPISAVAADTFSVRWTGQIEALYSETYTFTTTSDDGVRLWVNDRLIIDEWNDHASTDHTGQIELEAGVRYDIRMEYYENGGDAVAKLAWSSASQTLEIIPASQLYAAADPGVPADDLQTETIASGLVRPTAIDWSADGRNLYIAEQRGLVKVVRDGDTLATPFIDIRDQVNGVRDRGLLDIAVHPDFENTPYIYLLFTYDPPEVYENSSHPLAGPDQRGNRAGRLIRVTADASTNYTTAVAGSEVVLLGKNSTWENFNAFANSTNDFNEPPAGIVNGQNIEDFIASDSESHTVGALAFGIDGNLFVSIGDGTSYNRVDPRTVRVQDVDNLSGKVLRINPITGEGLADNPFYNGDADANRSKVYYLGLRNPFRMTVDPVTGQLFVGDVGWTQWEEVNTGPAGANFGWPYFEGGSGQSLRTGGYQNLTEAQTFYNSGAQVTAPIYGLSHSADGINAIVMGDVYRGTNYPSQFQGSLFVNDLGQGIVRAVEITPDGTAGAVRQFATGANLVVQMSAGPDGSMYFVDLNDSKVGRWFFT